MPQITVLHVWGTRRAAVLPALLLTAAWQVARLSSTAPSFGKSLGTGSGQTFTMRDADPGHWALLTTWPDAVAAAAFESTALVRAWRRISHEHLRITMTPISSRGQWSGMQPFSVDSQQPPTHGAVAAITRARIRPRYWRTFAASVPKVSADAHAINGPVFSLGIGEAPIGLQGTFSIWRTSDDINDFAYRRSAHRDVIARTQQTGWYAEELFARLQVVSCEGTYNGKPVVLP